MFAAFPKLLRHGGQVILAALLCLTGLPASGQESQPQRIPPANYSISPNDLLEIRVFQEDDLTTIVRVPNDGMISFPLVGKVKVGGLSLSQATDSIKSRLARDYLVNPQVNIAITEYAKRRFTIIGQVQTPGTYDFPDEETLDLLAAVGVAGGFTRIANTAKLTLKRTVNGKDIVMRLNAKSMARDGDASRFTVLPGDVISVPESLF